MAVKKNKTEEVNTAAVNANAAPENAGPNDAAVQVEAVVTDAAVLAETVTETKEGEGDVMEVLSDIVEGINSLSDGGEQGETQVRVKKHTFGLTDKIPCKSLFHGKLVYTNPNNGARHIWSEYGKVQHITLAELETMNNTKPDILNKPMLLILEPAIVEDFNFGDVYRKVAKFNKLSSILETGRLDLIRTTVQELVQVGMRESVIADMRKRRSENTLVDINIINMLKTELKCDIE